MLKFLSLLISFVLIASGLISCAAPGLVGSRKKIIDQPVVNTVNQNDNYQQNLPQPEKENTTNQGVSANIPTKKKPPTIANTENKQSVDKEHVGNLPGVKQGQIKRIQVSLAHLALGIAYTERDLTDQAVYEFQCAIEANPRQLESHLRLGIMYGLKGMSNEARSEFKNAININLDEAVAKIVSTSLPVTTNQKAKTDIVKAHINLGNAYREEGKLERSRIEYEKALVLKSEHPIASISLSEIYYSLGTSCLKNKEYDNAIDSFNKVVELNPEFPQIKDALEKAHYNLGINYAENGKLDKAIIEFNKTMEIKRYAMLDKNSLITINNDKKATPDKYIRQDRKLPDENTNNSTNLDKKIESFHEEKEEAIQNQIPHQIDTAREMILAEKENTEEPEYDQDKNESQHPLPLHEGNKRILALSNEVPFGAEQSQKADGLIQERVHLKAEISNGRQDKKQFQGKVAHAKDVKTGETDINELEFVDQEKDASLLVSGEEDTENSNYRVYTYNITRNYKTQLGINEAIKIFEDATINNPYDNNAFLNLAHAYYCKAMYFDDAIAMREDAPEGNHNISVKRFYLIDGADNEKNSETNTFGNNIVFHTRSGNMYEEMFREAIVEYKSALRINPNSSNSLYGLAFSFSVKGSHLEIASRGKKKYKKTSFR
ncbi:MAG: tetratricopeptide repeat protein [Candidatus Scalindua sp.]|nr:tetratricopeptide repeat protein [Candidatus Scalindua sp.]